MHTSSQNQTNDQNAKSALILGATGLVGSYVLNQLLAHPNYNKVIVLVRRPLQGSSYHSPHAETLRNCEKLVQIVTDFDDFSEIASNLPIDDVYCCLGTTIKKAGSQSAFKHVDFHIPLNFASYCYKYQTTDNKAHESQNNSANEAIKNETASNETTSSTFKFFGLVSSVGADSKSKVFYSKTKGEIEQALCDFPSSLSLHEKAQEAEQALAQNLTIVRPSIILGPRTEKRLGEDLGKLLMKIFSFAFIGNLKRYKPVHAADIAAALITSANSINHQSSNAGVNTHASKETEQTRVIESDEIERNEARY